jgi:transcriptional regulator with XRE-family HTH domain
MLLANELKAAGETQEAIARALGIGTNTLATHYFPSGLASPPMGRRRHAPTLATRTIVRRAILGGMTQAKVAKLIGVSAPTLRLHYRDELQR